MIPLVEQHRKEIAALCERYGVRKLDVFGSAATGTFNAERSDLDFIVDFSDYGPGIAGRFVDFADALEALFGRRVDVITEPTKRNPYFWVSVNERRETVYESAVREAAV
jgi:predicted nucleotidyltransferase